MVLFSVLVVGATYATIGWVVEAYGGGDEKQSCNVGAITGEVGCVRGWDLVSSGDEYIVTDADLAGQWAKNGAQSQYQLQTCSAEAGPDTHYHYYKLASGTYNDYKTVQAQAIQTLIMDGAAWRYWLSDSEWWWIPSVDYDDQGISLEVQNANSGAWSQESWGTTHYDAPANYLSQNSGQGGRPQPSSNSHAGEIRVAAALPVGVPVGTRIRVGFGWEVTATASVDNGTVQQWEEGILYTAFSNLSEDAHTVDFDLDALAQ